MDEVALETSETQLKGSSSCMYVDDDRIENLHMRVSLFYFFRLLEKNH